MLLGLINFITGVTDQTPELKFLTYQKIMIYLILITTIILIVQIVIKLVVLCVEQYKSFRLESKVKNAIKKNELSNIDGQKSRWIKEEIDKIFNQKLDKDEIQIQEDKNQDEDQDILNAVEERDLNDRRMAPYQNLINLRPKISKKSQMNRKKLKLHDRNQLEESQAYLNDSIQNHTQRQDVYDDPFDFDMERELEFNRRNQVGMKNVHKKRQTNKVLFNVR